MVLEGRLQHKTRKRENPRSSKAQVIPHLPYGIASDKTSECATYAEHNQNVCSQNDIGYIFYKSLAHATATIKTYRHKIRHQFI